MTLSDYIAKGHIAESVLMSYKLVDGHFRSKQDLLIGMSPNSTEAEVQGGGIQLYVTTLEKTLLKLDFPNNLNEVTEQRLNGLVSDEDVDKTIYSLYNLTKEEIDFIHFCKQVNR